MKKKIKSYELKETIARTQNAVLHKAVKPNEYGKEEKFYYAIKEYTKNDLPKGILQREKEISDEIENCAKKSIIIPILEVIAEGEKEYAVMQFRQNGLFLSEMIEILESKYGKGEIPIAIQLEIISKILISLQELHSITIERKKSGYLHMDIHPGNIFFESADVGNGSIGIAKFIDFSSALRMNENHKAIRKEDSIAITQDYSAPEQWSFGYQSFSPATDLYAVAVIETRLFAGDMDYRDHIGVLKKCFSNREKVSIVEEIIFEFLCCGLEYNPTYRYESAADMFDTIDKIRNSNEAYLNMDYYNLFCMAYEMIVPVEKVNVAGMDYKEQNIQRAVSQLANDLIKNNINYSKCTYLFYCLDKFIKLYEKFVPYKIRSSLLNSGIACYNHRGESIQALRLFEELEQNKALIELDEYNSILTRIAVAYADLYRFKDARLIVERNIQILIKRKQANNRIAEEYGLRPVKRKDLARAYSALGTYQVLTHQGNPMEMFEKAMLEFGDDEGNKRITRTHILQYAIGKKDKELYKKEIMEYVGRYKSVEEYLNFIMNKEKCNMYEVLIILKGIYTFSSDLVNDEVERILRELIDNRKLRDCFDHPIQLIYKYIALLLYKKTGKVDEDVDEAFYYSITHLERGVIDLQEPLNILMCITYQTIWLYHKIRGWDKENKELLEVMKQHSKESNWSELYSLLIEKNSIEDILEYENT